MAVSEFKYESCIRGYHIYKDIWNSTVGEHLLGDGYSAMPLSKVL